MPLDSALSIRGGTVGLGCVMLWLSQAARPIEWAGSARAAVSLLLSPLTAYAVAVLLGLLWLSTLNDGWPRLVFLFGRAPFFILGEIWPVNIPESSRR